MITLKGEPVANLSPAGRRARGLAFVPEERLGRGAVPEMSLADNALLIAAIQLPGHSARLVRGDQVVEQVENGICILDDLDCPSD